jgi:hypothetical protein
MTSIFINYRRDDTSGYAGRIHERLASTFGNGSVFMDLDDIRPGVNFVQAIDESLTFPERRRRFTVYSLDGPSGEGIAVLEMTYPAEAL